MHFIKGENCNDAKRIISAYDAKNIYIFINRNNKKKVMLILKKSKFLLPLRHVISCNYTTGNWYKSMFTPNKYEPPYDHIVQIGDPILRLKADPVPEECIKSEEIKFLLKKMKTVLKDYSLVGMASPQIGISLRIFIIFFEEKLKKKFTPEIYKCKEMESLPLTVFINPVIKVLNYEKINFEEGCASISGYSAEVTRSREISISAFNENGEKFTKILKGWNAR